MSNLFLSVLSGFLLALSFPKPEVSFLAWFGFVFLFFAIRKSSTYREVFLLSYLCGLVFFAIAVYWVIHVSFIGAVVLVFYLALYFGIFGLGVKWVENNFKQRVFKVFLIAAFWVSLEFIRSYIFTGFSWALLGYSQYMHIKLIQIADITGPYGLSFFIMFANIAVFYSQDTGSVLVDKRNKIGFLIQRWLAVFIALLLLLACLGYGNATIKKFRAQKKSLISVSVIQGNIDQEFKWDETLENLILNKYENLSRMAAFDKPDIIIWPETSLPGYLNEEKLRNRVSKIAASLSVPLLIGAPRFSPTDNAYFNSAVFFDERGSLTGVYDKLHLVPFGEYVPLGRLLSPITFVYPIADFSKGSEHVLFEVEGVKFGALICFEDIFPDLVRVFVSKGADFMVNITNDAWFKKSSAAYQHNQALVFRAVENKISMVRVGNTGPSLFIEPTGVIKQSLINQRNQDIFIDGFLTAKVTEGLKGTFFARFGNIFAYVCIIFFLLNFLWKAYEKRLF